MNEWDYQNKSDEQPESKEQGNNQNYYHQEPPKTSGRGTEYHNSYTNGNSYSYNNDYQRNDAYRYNRSENGYDNSRYNRQGYAYQYNQQPSPPPQTPKPDNGNRNSGKGKTIFIILLCVVIIISGIGIAMGIKSSKDNGDSVKRETDPNAPSMSINDTPDNRATTNAKGELTSTEVAKKIEPSIVGIISTVRTSQNGRPATANGEGTGIVMGVDKTNTYTYIVTCAHVISDKGAVVTVQLKDGTTYKAAIVGYDARTDVGVLRIKANNLIPAEFGDSDKLEVGQQVFAVGNPGGTEFFGSFTGGYVSAINRPINSEIGYSMTCIQHDAAISPGNSGGALVNAYGQVIGINSSKLSSTDYDNIGFAIPIKSAKEIVDKLIANGYVPGRPKLGITYAAASSIQGYQMIVQMKDLPAGSIVINSISSDSDLAKSNVKAGDMIIAVNGKDLDNANTLLELIENSKVGTELTLTICRVDQNYKLSQFDVKAKLIEDTGEIPAEEQSTSEEYYNPFGY